VNQNISYVVEERKWSKHTPVFRSASLMFASMYFLAPGIMPTRPRNAKRPCMDINTVLANIILSLPWPGCVYAVGGEQLQRGELIFLLRTLFEVRTRLYILIA